MKNQKSIELNKVLRDIAFALLTFNFTFLNAQAQHLSKKVLFLGNSYTYVNNLPQMVADVATSMGDTLIFDSNTPGGCTLEQHFADNTSRNKIMAKGWDYVILQEQSQLPAMEDYSQFFNGSHELCNLINQYNPCARTMFYMTWGRQNGDGPSWPPKSTYEGMDSLLHLRYMEIALYNNAGVSPVGAVWRYVRQHYPGIVLYQSDGSHPSVAGTYVAACCFYTALFHKNPALITYNYTLSPTEAADIRNAAKIIVYDSLQNWHLEKCFPTAGFIYTIDTGINQVNFINKSRYSENYLWDFGDGSTSTVENPMHNYLSDGSYLITLTTSNCDSSVIHESIFQQNINFCSFTPTIFPDSLILCPNSKDTLWTQTYNSYQWYDSNGNIIPGATNQYLVVSADSIASEGKKFSVLTTKNNCSEMSRQAVRYMINWIRSDVYEVFDSMLPGNPCLGDTVKLILAYPIEHYTQWFNNGIPIPFANNDTLIVIASGNYQVSFYPYTCPDLISDSTPIILTFIDCNNGILENTKLPKVLVYPNPADGFINVKINSELVGTDYTIINILGNIMRTGKFEKEINNFKINDLNNGIYILKIGKINKQIIKLIKP